MAFSLEQLKHALAGKKSLVEFAVSIPGLTTTKRERYSSRPKTSITQKGYNMIIEALESALDINNLYDEKLFLVCVGSIWEETLSYRYPVISRTTLEEKVKILDIYFDQLRPVLECGEPVKPLPESIRCPKPVSELIKIGDKHVMCRRHSRNVFVKVSKIDEENDRVYFEPVVSSCTYTKEEHDIYHDGHYTYTYTVDWDTKSKRHKKFSRPLYYPCGRVKTYWETGGYAYCYVKKYDDECLTETEYFGRFD